MYEFFWIVALILFAIVEFATSGLVSIWFAGGSLVALIFALCKLPLILQIVAFIVVSAILIVVFRKLAAKYIKTSKQDTDLDRIIGKVISVTERVDNSENTGRGKINDVEWKLRSVDGEVIEQGEKCTVEKIEGVSLIVKKRGE